jgi:hypothetical protein
MLRRVLRMRNSISGVFMDIARKFVDGRFGV